MEYRYHRFFLVTQSDKIKKWINDMSSKGLQLDRMEGYGTFVFRDGLVGEYQYDVQLMHKQEKEDSNGNGYFDFLRDMNIEVLITSKTDVVVFKRSSEYGELSLYNDPTPHIKYLKRVRWYSYAIVAMMAFNFVHLTYRYFESLSIQREMQILIDQIYEEQGIMLQNIEPTPLIIVLFLAFGLGICICIVTTIELKIHRLKKEVPEDSTDSKKGPF